MIKEKVKFEVMAPIDTAPKDKTIIVWNPASFRDEKVTFDSSWGKGRGAWFNDRNQIIAAKCWNPYQTSIRKDCSDISDMAEKVSA